MRYVVSMFLRPSHTVTGLDTARIFCHNEAGRTIRPAKVRQRSSGGAGEPLPPSRIRARTVLPIYRREMGISKLDALRGLFYGRSWLPTGLEPT